MFKEIARAKGVPGINGFKKYAEIAKEEREKGFENSVRPDGVRWKALEFKTILRKTGKHTTTRIRKGELYKSKVRSYGSRMGSALEKGSDVRSIAPSKPLIDSGILMKTTTFATNAKGTVRLAGSRSVPVWKGKSISVIHDEGTGKIPRRHHWAIYDKAKTRIDDAFRILFNRFVRETIAKYK